MGNAFLEEMKRKQQKCFEAGCEITAQQFFDYLCVVLNNPDVMKKDVFGADRLKIIQEALKETDKFFSEAFVNSEESDYYQEKLDDILRGIFDEIEPFSKRYPYVKDWNYNKPSKKGK